MILQKDQPMTTLYASPIVLFILFLILGLIASVTGLHGHEKAANVIIHLSFWCGLSAAFAGFAVARHMGENKDQ